MFEFGFGHCVCFLVGIRQHMMDGMGWDGMGWDGMDG